MSKRTYHTLAGLAFLSGSILGISTEPGAGHAAALLIGVAVPIWLLIKAPSGD